MPTNFPETVLDFINHSTFLLKEKNIPEARLNVELLLCDVLKCKRVDLYLNFEKPLSNYEKRELKEFITRRIKHEPVQYILGKAAFFGMDFIVNKNVLIPRQETELLVERVIEEIKKEGKEHISIFEIGTGTGCISISLAKFLEDNKISYDIFSIDISNGALEVAEKNLAENIPGSDKIRFYKKDIFEIEKLTKGFDYIISNPPYISNDDYKNTTSEVRCYEPEIALTDFGNGLKFFDRIFLIASNDSFKGKVFCEIGFNQTGEIKLLLSKYKLIDYDFYEDYNGINRILKIKK